MTNKIIITSGLALFAMFFGAGNIIYPLELGAQAGNHIPYVILAFIISGIGLPFLGLFATSLYHGDYWVFFNRLGKVPAFLLITFLILIIGPLFAIPRTETVAYYSLRSFLPMTLNNSYVFSGLYCLVLFSLTYQQNKVIDLIGRIMSPIKLTLFAILIIVGLTTGQHDTLVYKNSIPAAFKLGLVDGYSTMDLLATFFFCTAVYGNIILKARAIGITEPEVLVKIFFKSCLIGASLLGIVYVGFMLLTLYHASELQGVETAQMIVAISSLVLGKVGALFIGICVTFACMVTAMALTDITATFGYEQIVKKKVSRTTCLVVTIAAIYGMSIVGFAGIMKIALPILEVLYPALIVFCIVNIVIKLWSERQSTRLDPLACSVDLAPLQ